MIEATVLTPLVILVGSQFALYLAGWLLCGLVAVEERAAAWHWAAFMLLLAVGMALAAERTETRDWWAYVGSSIVWLLAYAMLNRGLELFLRLPGWNRLQAGIVVVTTLALIGIGPSTAMAPWRVLLTYGAIALLLSASMVRAWPATKDEFGWRLAVVLASPGALMVVVCSVRLVQQLHDVTRSLEMHRDSLANTQLLIAYLVMGAVFNFSMLGMLITRFVTRLRELALRDPLTAVLNRRAFDLELQREWRRAQRSGISFALLMIDVDHFKRINDEHGHPAGDAVLAEVARRLRQTSRGTDLVARIGGEEFAVILQAAQVGNAVDAAERLRGALSATPVFFGGDSIAVRASIGLALARVSGPSPSALIQRADAALYAAKAAGRDRVCFDPN